MTPFEIGGLALAAALLGAGGAYAAVRLSGRTQLKLDTSRFQDELRQAEARTQELLEKARKDAEQIVRDAELRSRDEAFHRRDEVNRELEAARTELREQERRGGERGDGAPPKTKENAQKERPPEGDPKKIAPR